MFLYLFQDWPHYSAQSLRSLLQTRTMFKSITAFSIGRLIANCLGRFGALPHRLSSRSLPLHASQWMRTDCLTYEHSLCFDSISSAPLDNRELRVLFFHDELLSEHDIGVKFTADIPNGRNGDVPGFQRYRSESFHRATISTRAQRSTFNHWPTV
jgi:hypothetical protein